MSTSLVLLSLFIFLSLKKQPSEVFYKNGVLKNFIIFFKRRLRDRCFLVNFANFLKTIKVIFPHSEAVAQRCSVRKVFLEISQNSQKNTCARVSF